MNGSIPLGEFVLGCALLGLTLACAAAAAWLAVGRRLAHLTGAPRAAAIGLLTLAGVLIAELVPLAVGILTRGSEAIAAAGLLIAADLATRRGIRTEPRRPRSGDGRDPVALGGFPHGLGSGGAVSWLLAAGGAALFVAYVLVDLRVHASDRPVSVDALGFHLPGVIRFIQSGTLWQTTQYLPGQAQGNYPQFGDLLLLAAVLPWHSLAFVRDIGPLVLILAGVSVYGICRELRAPVPTAVLAACAVLSLGPVLTAALRDQMTDPTFFAAFSTGVLFLLRHWRDGRRAELVLAGVGFGVALGTKWYGLTDVPLVVICWGAAWLLARRGVRPLTRPAGTLVGTIAAGGSAWLVRNLILTGNPVFDYRVSMFGVTIFDAPTSPVRQRIGFSIAHYVSRPDVLRHYMWPAFRSDYGLAGAVIVAGALLAVALTLAVVLSSRGREASNLDPRVPLLAVLAGALALAYAITPYSAQGLEGAPILVNANTRYGVPALIVAAPLLGWLASRSARWRILLELLLLAAIAQGVRAHLAAPGSEVAVTVVVLAAALGAALWFGLHRPLLPRATGSGARRAGVGSRRLAGTGLVMVGGLAAAGYHYQRLFAERPYSVSDAAVSYVLAHAPAHARIGLAGEWTATGLVPVAPVFGLRLDNAVRFVGPFVRHVLREYPDRASFVASLRRDRIEMLVLGTGFPPAAHPRLEGWARSAGFVPVARSARLIALRAPSR